MQVSEVIRWCDLKMTKEEAVKLLVCDGMDAVGVSVFPQSFSTCDEWEAVLVEAARQKPELVQQMTQENIDKANMRIASLRQLAEDIQRESQRDFSN
jgi:hypothetical protein